jgi:hypothetical protein
VFLAGFKAGLFSCKDKDYDVKGYHDKEEKDVVKLYEEHYSKHYSDKMAEDWSSWAFKTIVKVSYEEQQI